MLEEGILDSVKVTRLRLQNASSVAGQLLTTEVVIAEAPKHDENAHDGGAPGGTGGDGYVRSGDAHYDQSFSRRLEDKKSPAGNRRGLFYLAVCAMTFPGRESNWTAIMRTLDLELVQA